MVPDADPIALVIAAMEQARLVEPHDPTAVTLATADARGRPSARMVLLKGVDAGGFTFFTNYRSRKARELSVNPYAALCFHWPASERQVRVAGRVEPVSKQESDAYFATRARESQLGAWASQQSAPLASREELEARLRELAARYPVAVPRPLYWGGYRLIPTEIELWQAGAARLHDRVLYTRTLEVWAMQRLNP